MKQIYKTPMSNLAGAALLLLALLMSFPAAEALAADPPDNAYRLRAADVFRCGEGTLEITATWDETIVGFDENNIRWYKQPFYGEHIHTGATFETPLLERSKTYYIDYIHTNEFGQEECGICDRIVVRANVSYETIENRISYPGNFFCKIAGIYEPTISGITGGTFSAVEVDGETASLTIDAQSGVINPETSDIATFEISYTPPTVPGCPTTPATWMVTITEQPVETEINYPGDKKYCASEGAGVLQVSFDAGYPDPKPENAFFSSTPSGLILNSSNGEINLAESQTGVYTITYTVPGGGGCAPVFAHTSVEIEQLPQAEITYATSPFCGDLAEGQLPNITGNINGTFSSTAGLIIDTTTGVITPTESTAGIYTVVYTIAATDICPEVKVETSLEILPALVATVSATTTEAFAVIDDDVVVTFKGTTGDAPFTFFYRSGDETAPIQEVTSNDTGTATVTQVTLVPGTYTYTLVSVTDANDCNATISDESVVITVNPTPVAEFSYPDTPYCQDVGIATPTFIGQIGDFTVSPTATFNIDDQGKINLATSDPGTYEVTNTVAGGVSHTTEITITKTPNPVFTYDKDSFCPGTDIFAIPNYDDSYFDALGVFTADSPDLAFATEEGDAPGTIDVNASFPGQYSITYTLPASGGCPEVSHTISITIDTPPAVISPRDYIICSGETVEIGFESEPPGATFEWRVATITDTITGATVGQTGTAEPGSNTITFTLINSSVTESGEMVLTVTPTMADEGACSTGPAVEVVVTVRPIPQLSSTLTPSTICSGALFEYTPESEHEAASFSWSRAEVAGITEAASDGTGTVSETLTNTSTAPVDVTYVYTTSADGCSREENVVVTVNPLGHVGTVTNLAVCYNTEVGPFNFTTANTDGTTTYAWTNDNEDIGLAADGTGNISAFTVTNTTLATITATITVTPSFINDEISCVGVPVSFSITVYPPPANPTTVYDDNTRTVGYTGHVFTVTATTTTAGATIKWYEDQVGITTTTAPTGTATGTYKAWAEAEHDVTGCVSTQRIEVSLIIAPVIIDNKGYFNLNDAFKAIEEGTHTGDVVVEIYANTVEDEGAELDLTKDHVDVNSVEIKAMNPDVTITGGVTLIGSSE